MNRALAAVLSILVALVVFLVPAGSPASAAEPGTISGTVTVAGTGSTSTTLHTQAQIQLLTNGTWQSVENAYTDHLGTYSSQPLSPGTYRVEFTNMDYVTQVSAPVKVTSAAGTVVDAVIDPGANIQGRFTIPPGGPVVDGSIRVYERSSSGDWLQVDYGLVDPNGTYVVGGLAGGSYKVGFSDFKGTYAPEFYDNVATLEQAQAIAVPPGTSVTGIDVELSTEQLPVPDLPVTSVGMDGRVRIVGTLRVGQRVRAKVKVLEPTDGVTLHYVWKVDGKRVAKKSSLRLKASMQGKRLSVEVKATAPGLDPARAYSTSKLVRPRR